MSAASGRDRVHAQSVSAQSPDLALHRTLTRLGSTISVMNTGAHPDDEQSGMLAALRFGSGVRTLIACSTRGEGGQSTLGPERGLALAVIRSREMEEAARVLDAEVVWLGHGPDDPVHDFGFSKDGDQTFARWGQERVIERLVRAYRQARPDIVIPTFLDVPGQHGHHRAMTRAARSAIALAADPEACPEHFKDGLSPWQVAKFYLPAWSGGGSTYDDEVPPPAATVTVRADGSDPATGVAYDQIGQWSRWFHASQGMGDWTDDPKTAWPLHLAVPDEGSRSERDIFEGLPACLADLASPDGHPDLVKALREADAQMVEAMRAFPDRPLIIAALTEAAVSLQTAISLAPPQMMAMHGHRLHRKVREIDAALIEAADLAPEAVLTRPVIAPGASTILKTRQEGRVPELELVLSKGVTAIRKDAGDFVLQVAADAPLSPLFRPGWSPLGGNDGAWLEVSARFGGHMAHQKQDFSQALSIQPGQSVSLTPDAIVGTPDDTDWSVVAQMSGKPAELGLTVPPAWSVETGADGDKAKLRIRAPKGRSTGLTVLTPTIDGKPAFDVLTVAYPHIGTVVIRSPAALRVLTLDLALPKNARIGYVGAGADRVGEWLCRMGLEAVDLAPADLQGDLSRFTTIVVGIGAFARRPDLAAALENVHRFVEDGGNLVTLYHRPDEWDADRVPPRRLRVGSPSLRWRVTDPTAEVRVLEPGHPLLNEPNVIGAGDWAGWNKERGLYFAADWDDAYRPLLSMHDPNEQPLRGALVSGRVGKGRHSHVSLILHHQLDRLVPGAFRLLANLVASAPT